MTNFPKQVTKWESSDGTVWDTAEAAQAQELLLSYGTRPGDAAEIFEWVVANREAVMRILGGYPWPVNPLETMPVLPTFPVFPAEDHGQCTCPRCQGITLTTTTGADVKVPRGTEGS